MHLAHMQTRKILCCNQSPKGYAVAVMMQLWGKWLGVKMKKRDGCEVDLHKQGPLRSLGHACHNRGYYILYQEGVCAPPHTGSGLLNGEGAPGSWFSPRTAGTPDLSLINLVITNYYYYPHVVDEETEAQRSGFEKAKYIKSMSKSELTARPPESQFWALTTMLSYLLWEDWLHQWFDLLDTEVVPHGVPSHQEVPCLKVTLLSVWS